MVATFQTPAAALSAAIFAATSSVIAARAACPASRSKGEKGSTPTAAATTSSRCSTVRCPPSATAR